MERVIVFIDGSNFYFGARAFGVRPPWNVVALAQDLARGRKLVRVYYYNARSRKNECSEEQYNGEEKFYSFLRNLDYCTVRLGRLEGKPGQMHQKGVDTLLVQDLLTLTFYDALDCAILVTNDGDFAQVVEEVKARGKQVEVAFFGEPSFHLREVCDRYVNLLRECESHFKKTEEWGPVRDSD